MKILNLNFILLLNQQTDLSRVPDMFLFFNLIFLFRRKSKDRRHLLMIPSLSFLSSDRIASVSNVVATTRRVSTIERRRFLFICFFWKKRNSWRKKDYLNEFVNQFSVFCHRRLLLVLYRKRHVQNKSNLLLKIIFTNMYNIIMNAD